MHCSIVIDWKFVGVLAIGVIGVVLACRMDKDDTTEAFNHLVDCGEAALSQNSLC